MMRFESCFDANKSEMRTPCQTCYVVFACITFSSFYTTFVDRLLPAKHRTMFSNYSLKARAGRVKNSSDSVALRAVDLQLPKEKIPAGLKDFRTKWAPRYDTIEGHVNSKSYMQRPNEKAPAGIPHFEWAPRYDTGEGHVNTKGFVKYAIGSSTEKHYSYRCELGLFECVKEVWEYHWNLRTSPEDWWFPVACRIAKAIDKAAKARWSSEKVRELFVSHKGKEEIKVEVPVFNIYQVDYDDLFSCFSSEIQKRIKVPDFATQMQNDFSTTTPSQQIASQINLMASVQEFFSYHTAICGCGIKGLEMLGTQADWDRLVTKLQAVEKQLSPIASDLGLGKEWLRHVEYVFRNLAQSYSHPGSTAVKDFWADVLCVGKDWKYGPSGFGGHEVEAYNGWLVKFLTGKDSLWKENLSSSETRQELSGLNSVPMKVSLTYRNPVVSDESELRAGIMGFLLVEPEATFNHVPALQPDHVWAMMLPPQSPLRDA